jgi:hypothetical protein
MKDHLDNAHGLMTGPEGALCGGDIEMSKGKGKGKVEVFVPMDDDRGPIWVQEGWVHGYKVFIGDLPKSIGKMDLAHCTQGQADLAVNANASRSGMAYAIVTFLDLEEAVACFKKACGIRFDHGQGQWHWASVKWFRGRAGRNV